MTRAALAVVLLAAAVGCAGGPRASAPARDPGVPPQIANIVTRHCVRCHDGKGDSTLDLRRLPSHDDARTWLHMLEMVEGYRMPPPAHDGPVEKRFPLPAEQREVFLEQVTRMLGPAADPVAYTRHLSFDHWLAIVNDVAAPVLPDDGADEVIHAAMGALKPVGVLEARGRIKPHDRLVVESVSVAVCRAIAKAEAARPAAARRLMVGLPADDASAAPADATRQIVETLHRAVYQETPAADDLDADVRLLAAVRAASPSWPEAWVGLCTAFLSSPRVLYLYSGAR